MENKLLQAQHFFITENYDSAVKILNEYIETNETTDKFEASFTRASCYIKLKEFGNAIEDLSECEKIKNSSELQYKKGIAHFYLNEFAFAFECFKQALLLSTTNEQREKLSLWKNKVDIEIEENKIIINAKTEQQQESNIKIIHNWYQTPSHVTLTLESNIEFNNDDLTITLAKKTICVKYNKTNSTIFDIVLSNSIAPDSSSYEINKKRVIFNLKKEIENFNWVTLDATKVQEVESSFRPSYPTSSKVKKDWNNIDKEIEKELNKDVEGEEGLMKLFKEIYERGDENTRRAMIKSMQTSSGTVLSPNWGEVSDKDYEGKDKPDAPKGQAWTK
jgi:tetratricopeptide (TPR) repeat protein